MSTRKVNSVLLSFLMLFTGIVFSQSVFHTVRQPNGKTFQAKDSGYCCTVMWYETPDGYVLTLGPDGYYCYTSMDEKSSLIPTAEKAGIDSPKGGAIKATDATFKNSIQRKVDDFNAAALENRKKCDATNLETGLGEPKQSNIETQYFPLQVGNEWTYYSTEGGVTDTIPSAFYSVFDTVSVEGKKYFMYGLDSNYPEYYRPDSLGHIFRYIEGNEILWFDFTRAVGDSYQIDLSSLNLHYRVHVLGRNEIVENHAGRFENCTRFFFDDSSQVDDAFELWFAKGVGIVKRFLPHAISKQLYSAKVNGKIYPDTVTSVKSKGTEVYPKQIFLFQNYPNPFNNEMIIKYEIPEDKQVSLKIYDITGKEVITLIDQNQPPGVHRVKWQGKNQKGGEVTSGIYVYQLNAGHFIETKKAIFVK